MEQRVSLITLGVADVARSRAFYEALGWATSAEPGSDVAVARTGAETFWGGYSGVFVDPDGHAWEIAHNPFWVLTEDGSVSLAPDQADASGVWLKPDPSLYRRRPRRAPA
jgi:predicted lactoylglutathione lyase